MNLVVDIDDTLIITPKENINGFMIYHTDKAKPIQEEIDLINEHYDKGDIIILWTGRNWDKYEITKKQLMEHKIKYHELVMGKPLGIYIDKDSIKTLKDIKKHTY